MFTQPQLQVYCAAEGRHLNVIRNLFQQGEAYLTGTESIPSERSLFISGGVLVLLDWSGGMCMRGNVSVNQAADHLLIFQAMFAGLGFEKIHTVFG